MRSWFLLLALAACVDKGPGDPGPQIDETYIEEHLLEAPPAAIAHRFDATFGDAVVYLGNDLQTTKVEPGDKVVITHYWKVVKPPGAQWRIFSHLRGVAGDFLNADLTDMRTGYPAAKWEVGAIIKDEQTFVVDKYWKSPTAQLVVGLFQKGKHKITDRMPVTGQGAQDDRSLVVATLQVDLSKTPAPPGSLMLKKAPGAIVIDGKADEPGWANAAVQTSFTTAEGCSSDMPWGTTAKLTWDDRYLYLFASAEDPDVHSEFTKQDDHLWEQDVIEMFIDADGNRRGYVELQTNPRNVHFDTWFVGVRPNRDDSFDAGLVSQVVVKGTIDQRDDGDVGWDLELAIPMAAVMGKDPKMKVHVPPQPGDIWRLNVVRSDKAADGVQRASSWNTIDCSDFHALDRMLTVQFATATGDLKPPPAPVLPEAPVLAASDGGVPEAPDAGAAIAPRVHAPVKPPTTPVAPPNP